MEKGSLENDERKNGLLIRGEKELLVRIGAEDVENGIDSVHQSVGARGQDVVGITFTESASNMLRTFSDKHRGRLVAVIVDHKVRHVTRLRSRLSRTIFLDVEKWPVSIGEGRGSPLSETRMFYWHPLFIPFVLMSLIFIAFLVLAIIPVPIDENRGVPLTLRIIIAVLTLLIGAMWVGVEQTRALAEGMLQHETNITCKFHKELSKRSFLSNRGVLRGRMAELLSRETKKY